MSGDESGPSQSEDSKISQFMEFSGVEDLGTARTMLERAGWDLELAIQEALNHSEGQPSLFSQEGRENAANQEQELRRRRQVPSAPPMPPHIVQRRVDLRRGPRVVGGQRGGWTSYIMNLVLFPVRFTLSVFYDIFGFIYNTFFRRPQPVTDPRGDVRGFIQAFEEKYGSTHPRFYAGSYSEALTEVKKDLKFLLVYLHSPVHQDTDRFCSRVLCDPNLVTFLDANVTVWGVSVRSPEGARVSRTMRESRYPFLALICLRDGYMAMVFRQEGFIDTPGLVNLLTIAMEDNNAYLNAARQQRVAYEQNSLLRTEQEQQFEDIQRADRERSKPEEKKWKDRKCDVREEARRATEEAAAVEERKAAAAQAALDDKATRLQHKKVEIKGRLGPEPKEAKDGDSLVRLSLKFPSGTRLQRNFLASQSLEDLFNVCLVHEECPADFSLVTNFPRKVLRCAPEWAKEYFPQAETGTIPSFADAQLTGSAMVFVQDNAA